MASIRAEVEFTLGDKQYRKRPTFDLIERLENQYGAAPAVIERIRTGNFGMAQTAGALLTILGEERDGGPTTEELKGGVQDAYVELANTVAKFLLEGIRVPGASGKRPPGGNQTTQG